MRIILLQPTIQSNLTNNTFFLCVCQKPRTLAPYQPTHTHTPTQKYEVEFLLQQQWDDPRLRYANQSNYSFLNAIHHHENIWLPDTYFIMHGDFKEPIVPMHFALRIYRNGTINYLMRWVDCEHRIAYRVWGEKWVVHHCHVCITGSRALFSCVLQVVCLTHLRRVGVIKTRWWRWMV